MYPAKDLVRLKKTAPLISTFLNKWPDKSTTSYDMIDFKSYITNL